MTVGVAIPPGRMIETEASLDELAKLIDTAGADEVARVLQQRDRADPATYVGRGKAEELRAVSEDTDADTVVFDDELAPAQQRNLEHLLGRTAIDRTAVILDIFAQNARTNEGRAQVELALLRYRLPRLRGRGRSFSQQGGGIGTRGPGETQLEVDRRRIQQRIARLERELRSLERRRRVQRSRRRRSDLRSVSLVGYTNAGKSTLLNALTDAGVLAEDRLFATLDPRARRLELPGGEVVLCSDTVGFVRKLPHQLVESFSSTLEVVAESDLLVHVADASSSDPDGEIEAVRSVLCQIGAGEVPELLVVNKADLVPQTAERLAGRYEGSIVISARQQAGMDQLRYAIAEWLSRGDTFVGLVVPYDRGDVRAAVHRAGSVLAESAERDGWRLYVRLGPASLARFSGYRSDDAGDGAGSGHGENR